MNRSTPLCLLLLIACDPKEEGPSDHDTDLNDTRCLELDQLEALRSAVRIADNKALSGQLVDATPRQVEEYGKTGKWPAQTQGEVDQDEKDARSALMGVSDILSTGACMDRAISDCIAEGGKGMLCFNMSVRACPGYKAKSNCDPGVGDSDGND